MHKRSTTSSGNKGRTRKVLIVPVVFLLALTPLFAVWRQVYITNAAMRNDALADSLRVLGRDVEHSSVVLEGLSQRRRIEKIARKACKLDYPESTEDIIVLGGKKPRPLKSAFADWGFFALIRESLKRQEG
ncbi:MAG: hypothetical protein GF398_12790 [Chitinivibrionales bacterium]|nr:hypothetical protein [Chitinivibrionales bacterium]